MWQRLAPIAQALDLKLVKIDVANLADVPAAFDMALREKATALFASYVDSLARGAKAGDLPVEQPTKLEFVINLKTAKALRITIPRSLLARADHVIQ